jgi:hypothetical protein
MAASFLPAKDVKDLAAMFEETIRKAAFAMAVEYEGAVTGISQKRSQRSSAS